jgi:hypothetical protein
MANETVEQIEGLFSRLETAVKNGQAKRGLKAADESELWRAGPPLRLVLEATTLWAGQHAATAAGGALGLPSHPVRCRRPAAAAVLKLAPSDQDALRCKAVLFIESGNLEEALKLVGQPPLAASMAYEKVRCLACGTATGLRHSHWLAAQPAPLVF